MILRFPCYLLNSPDSLQQRLRKVSLSLEKRDSEIAGAELG